MRATDLTVIYMGRYTVSGSGARCKRVVNDSGGSTPSLPTIITDSLEIIGKLNDIAATWSGIMDNRDRAR